MFELSSYTGGIAVTNGYVLQTSGGTIAVDAPEGFADWLAGQGVKIDALLLTHHHFDHVMDAAKIKASHACPIYAYAQFSRDLSLEVLFGMVSGMSVSVDAFEVDHVLEGRTGLSLIGNEWTLLHVPGHSPDSLCFYSADLGLLFDGDVLMAGSMGRTDFPGGSIRQLIKGIWGKIMVLPEATRVLPGHGPETTIGEEKGTNEYIHLKT